MSEPQERMMAVVEPSLSTRFSDLCQVGRDATVIGEVTDGDRLVIDWRGEAMVAVPPRTVAHEGPVYERPYARPDWQTRSRQSKRPTAARRSGDELAAKVLRMAGAPNLCDKSWITDQYDRYVRGNRCWRSPMTAG